MIYGGKADADTGDCGTAVNQCSEYPHLKNMKAIYDLAIRGLTALGMFTALMFTLGYAYASIPVVLSKTCTPTFIDKLIK
jgi:hypothetical protein